MTRKKFPPIHPGEILLEEVLKSKRISSADASRKRSTRLHAPGSLRRGGCDHLITATLEPGVSGRDVSALEASQLLWMLGELFGKNLDGDFPPELGAPRAVDLSLPPSPTGARILQGPSVLLGVNEIASLLKFSGCPKNVGSRPNRIVAP